MVNLLFEPKHFQTVELTGKSPKCETIENISKAVTTRLSCYELGNTVDFLLTSHRDAKVALRFFKRAINNNGIPITITIDSSAANKAELRPFLGGKN